MKKYKTNSGITLIALVITIIVTLILVGISANILSGENGILKKSNQAKTDTEKSQLIELIHEKWYEYERENLKNNLTDAEKIEGFRNKLDEIKNFNYSIQPIRNTEEINNEIIEHVKFNIIIPKGQESEILTTILVS